MHEDDEDEDLIVVDVYDVETVYDGQILKIKPSKSSSPTGYSGKVDCPFCNQTHWHGSPLDPIWGKRPALCSIGKKWYRLVERPPWKETLDI